MSSPTGQMRKVAAVISRTDRLVRETGGREAICWLASLILAGMMLAVALDAVAQLPDWARAAISVAALVAVAVNVRRSWRQRKLRLSEERLARLLEERQPALDNALINAVQFEQQLPGAPEPSTRALMEHEIRRAERSAEQIDPEVNLDRGALVTAKRRLAGLAIAFAISAALLPRVYLAGVPRYLDPFGDHPPFSLTRFFVDPRGARVRSGDSITLRVRTAGAPAHGISLVTSTDGRKWDTLPLFQVAHDEYVQKLENLRSDTMFFIRSDGGRTRRYRLEVITAPQVKEAEVTYRYPAYTNQQAATEKLTAKGVQGLSGTKVTLRVTSNRPLGQGRLRLSLRGQRDGQVVPLVPKSRQSSEGIAEFTIRRAGQFAIDLVGADGLETREAAVGRIVLLRDEHPLVYVSEPGRPSFATPEVKVPITIEAEDSFGLRLLRLHRSLNESQDLPLDLALPSAHPREATWRVEMNLADLGVRPGDVIAYYATAYDTDPERRNYSDSEALWIRIISEKEYEQLLRRQTKLPELAAKYRDLLAEMQELVKEQQELADQTRRLKEATGGSTDPAHLQRLKELADEQARLAQRAAELSQTMRETAQQQPLFDIEKDLNKRLAQLAQGMGRVAEQMDSAAGHLGRAAKGEQRAANSAKARQAQEEALRRLGELGAQSQPLDKMLKELEKVYPLYEDLAKFLALVEAQGNLALKASELERATDPTPEQKARMDELAQAQGRIRDYLGRVTKDLHAHARQLRASYPELAAKAEAFARKVEGVPIAEHMTAAQESFREYEGDRGYQEAKKAFDLLRGLVDEGRNCQGGAKECLSGFCFGFGTDLGDTLSQLASGFQPGIGFGMGRGAGQGQGMGFGSGMGSGSGLSGSSGLGALGLDPAGLPGSEAPDLNLYGRRTPRGTRTHPSGERTRQQRKGPGAGAEGYLSASQVEVVTPHRGTPPDASGADEERFPAEYKTLVREYFRRVSEDAAQSAR